MVIGLGTCLLSGRVGAEGASPPDLNGTSLRYHKCGSNKIGGSATDIITHLDRDRCQWVLDRAKGLKIGPSSSVLLA